MADYIARATAADETIRAFAIQSKELVEEARRHHETTPVVTAALGRLLSGAAMMGSMMKGENDKLTIQMKGDGPIGQLTVTANSRGDVKGYPEVADVDIPEKTPGKLDVGSAVGRGTMTVIMDLGLREPYNGQVEIQTGEIGDDLAYYFTLSEQTPSAVGLGVFVDGEGAVAAAGGFIIQIMPGASEESIAALEEKLVGAPAVTSMLLEGKTPEEILSYYLSDLGMKITETSPARFFCDCSKERSRTAIAALNDSDLAEIVDEGEDIEVKCHFCNTGYNFTIDELRAIQEERAKRAGDNEGEVSL